MHAIDLHMTGEERTDGTRRLTLVSSGLNDDEEMTKIALWVRKCLRDNMSSIGIADPTASKLTMRQTQ